MNKLLLYIAPLVLILLGWYYFFTVPGISNLNDNKIGVLGHRGMGSSYQYPGNSAPSVLEALKLGADGCELDIQMTRDGSFVAYHHKKLDGYTNSSGLVYEKSLSEIEKLVYSGEFPEEVRVMSVDSLFSLIGETGNYIFSFDCKLYGLVKADTNQYFDQFLSALNNLLSKYRMEAKIFIESDNVDFHKRLAEADLDVLQFITGKGIHGGISVAADLGLYGIGVGSSVTSRDIKMAHNAGFRVMTWTPGNAFENVRAVRKNPDFIQTADLPHLIRFLGKN